jgi:hypothetical protein
MDDELKICGSGAFCAKEVFRIKSEWVHLYKA